MIREQSHRTPDLPDLLRPIASGPEVILRFELIQVAFVESLDESGGQRLGCYDGTGGGSLNVGSGGRKVRVRREVKVEVGGSVGRSIRRVRRVGGSRRYR